MDIFSNKRLLIIFGVIIALLSFLAGGLFQKTRTTGGNDPSGRKVLYYIDPMHPSYKSDKPGIAPDCGMKLEPVYADGAGVSAPT